ncbi:hypothetical protein T492DRAFT_512552 [Pavlovales sp. CCMP2436]|nr:hypothetical protein T492DRAFT_512552 [Pavlovales sp. CCMP2436]
MVQYTITYEAASGGVPPAPCLHNSMRNNFGTTSNRRCPRGIVREQPGEDERHVSVGEGVALLAAHHGGQQQQQLPLSRPPHAGRGQGDRGAGGGSLRGRPGEVVGAGRRGVSPSLPPPPPFDRGGLHLQRVGGEVEQSKCAHRRQARAHLPEGGRVKEPLPLNVMITTIK